MYRPPVKVIDHAPRRTEGTADTAATSSIYAQPRTIRSLGVTLGLASSASASASAGSAGSRLRAALDHAAGEDSDEDTSAAPVNPRTIQRLARHKPWRNSEADGEMRQAILQQLHAQNPNASATSRPASAAIRSTIAARSAQAAAHVAAASSRAAQVQAQPAHHPAVPAARHLSAAARASTPHLSALEASIRTLQADPTSWHPAPASTQSAHQRPQRHSLFAHEAAEETRPADSATSFSRPARFMARPTSAALRHPRASDPTASATGSAAGRSSRPASAAVGAHARPKRSPPPPPLPSSGASAVSAATPRAVPAAPVAAVVSPACIVCSFLRLTAPLATRVQLTQMKPLPFVLHSSRAVQFVEEADLTPSPTVVAALSAAAASSTASSRAASAPAAKVRYNPSLPAPPTPSPVFWFDGVFGPAPLSRGDAAEQQARDLFEAVRPMLELPRSDPSQQPQQQSLTTVAVVSMGVAGSGASETLFGGLGGDTPASSLSPRLSLHHPAGLIARFLHSLFAAASAEELPRGCSSSLQVSVSVLVLLSTDSSDSTEGSAIRRSTSALDLFRSELLDPMTGEVLSPPRWAESRLVFDASSGSASGMALRRFNSAQAACDAIGQAREIWNSRGAPMLRSRPGSFLVSVQCTRRDRFVDPVDSQLLSECSVSSVVRFFDVLACLREWSLAQMELLTTSRVVQRVLLEELDELHEMMGLRQTANDSAADLIPRRVECLPRSSCFARMLLPALNPAGRLVLLTHIAASGSGSFGPRAGTQLARHLCAHFGRPSESPAERETDAPRLNDGGALLSELQPFPAFLVDHIHPAVQRALPRLYAPLFDIILDYLGAGPNLSVRLRAKEKQRERTE